MRYLLLFLFYITSISAAVPHLFTEGEQISANKINENFVSTATISKATSIFTNAQIGDSHGTFTTDGGTLIIFTSGSCYRDRNACGYYLKIDDEVKGYETIYSTNQHIKLSKVFVINGIESGTHTVSLTVRSGSFNEWDRQDLSILELK